MLRRLLETCGLMSFRKVLLWGLAFAFVFEIFTVLFRFGFGLQTTEATAMIGSMTLGLRIHHGYIGLFFLLLGFPFPKGIRNALWIVGIGLMFSDLVHHFVVLWIWVGSPQFDFVYPNHPFWTTKPVLP
jgi:hypothetical protein